MVKSASFEETPVLASFFDEAKTKIKISWGGYYDHELVSAIKKVPGSVFKPAAKTQDGIPYWTVPAKIDVARELRVQFKDRLVLSPEVKAWGKQLNRKTNKLLSIHTTAGQELPNIKLRYPHLHDALFLGPKNKRMTPKERKRVLAKGGDGSFQMNDTRFMADCENPANFNHQGTGKTIETIAAVLENPDTEMGCKLVIGQLTSTVWEDDLAQFGSEDQIVLRATGSRTEREAVLRQAEELFKAGEAFWLIINAEMVRLVAEYEINEWTGKRMEKGTHYSYPWLFSVKWDVIVLDELQKTGLNDPTTLLSRGMQKMRCGKRMALTGTPMGGKIVKLFGILQWLEPDEFSSKWQFINKWLDVADGEYGKEVGELKEGMEEEFYNMLSRYAVRRTKDEVAPWLPPKNHIDLWVNMEGEQAEQYEEFALEAEIRIEEEHLSAVGILAEYTRLKQFASSTQRVKRFVKFNKKKNIDEEIITLTPVAPSCKLKAMSAIVEELDPKESDERFLVFSQFHDICDVAAEQLRKLRYKVAVIHGGVTVPERHEIVRNFVAGRLHGIVLNTIAAGTSLNLEQANTVIFLDETWNPDDQEQAEDRAHRTTKTDVVNVYTIRTHNTIESYIAEVTYGKSQVNFNVLDARRKGLRAYAIQKRKAT